MRCLFGCPDIVSLTEKFLMARNFYRIFTENNPVMGDSKTFCIPEAKGLINGIFLTCSFLTLQAKKYYRIVNQVSSLHPGPQKWDKLTII